MIRKSWYQNVDVQFELIHQTKHRETFFLPFDKLKNSTPPIRWMNASAIKFLRMHWDRYKFLEKDMNIYHSLSKYKNFPTFSYSWRVKSEQQRVWMKEFHKYITGYDLFVETDSKDIEKSHADTLKIKRFLDDYNMKYTCNFSLARDTPILIKIKNKIKLIEIKNAINYVNMGKVLTLDFENKIVWKKIINFISHHDKLINISHRQGGNIPTQCTKDHASFVLNPKTYEIYEKKGSDLKVGDFLITINNSQDIIKDEIKNIDFEYKYNGKIKKEKIKLTNELMWCLGAYLGDGSLTAHSIQLGKSDFDLVKRFGSYFDKQYYKIDKRGKYKDLLYVWINSKKWRDFFFYSCGKLAGNKHLPPFIWQLSKDKIYSFLEGYIDADGQKTNEHFVKIKSKSKTIIKELCWLLKLIGVSNRINKEIIKAHPNPQGKTIKGFTAYSIAINREELKGKISKYSKDKNKFSPESIDNCLPTEIFKELFKHIKPKIMGGGDGGRPDSLIRNKETLSREFLKKYLGWIKKTNKNKTKEVDNIIKNIENVLNSDVRITKITKITYNKTLSPVYDISVENTERFYTGIYPTLWCNSGSKGFHIILPYEEFSFLGLKIYDEEIEKKAGNFKFWMRNFPIKHEQLIKFSDLVLLFKLIAWRLHTILGCETIDTSVQDVKRVKKIAYSWDVKSGLIALPLTDEQLTNFRKDICRPKPVLKTGVHKRGLLWRNMDVDKEQREKKTLTFLQDLGILA